MKAQDVLFIGIFVILVILRRKWLWQAGIIAFAISGSLFLVTNLFTAQRFSWYGVAFMAVAVVVNLWACGRHRSLPEHN